MTAKEYIVKRLVSRLYGGGTANRVVGTTDGAAMIMTQLVNAMVSDSAAIDLTKLSNIPFCIMRTANTPNQTIATSTWTTITNFQTADEVFDPFGMHSGADDFMVAPSTGLYICIALIYVVGPDGTGSRYVSFTGLVGSNAVAWPANNADPAPYFTVQIGKVTAGSPVSISFWQNSGGNKTISNAYQPVFAMAKLGNA